MNMMNASNVEFSDLQFKTVSLSSNQYSDLLFTATKDCVFCCEVRYVSNYNYNESSSTNNRYNGEIGLVINKNVSNVLSVQIPLVVHVNGSYGAHSYYSYGGITKAFTIPLKAEQTVYARAYESVSSSYQARNTYFTYYTVTFK